MIDIPLSNGAENARQSFTAQLGEIYCDIRVYFLSYLDKPTWCIDVIRDGSPVVLGVALEPNGVIDLGVIGYLVLTGRDTTLDNLGRDNKLTWVAE